MPDEIESDTDIARRVMERVLTDSYLLTNGIRVLAREIADAGREVGVKLVKASKPNWYDHGKVSEPKSFEDLIVDIHASLLDYGLEGSVARGIRENVVRARKWGFWKAMFDLQASVAYTPELTKLQGDIIKAKGAADIACHSYEVLKRQANQEVWILGQAQLSLARQKADQRRTTGRAQRRI